MQNNILKMAKAKTSEGKISDLIPDDRNANRHSERGDALVEKSITELGAGRSVLADRNGKLIAGNKTVEKSIAAGLTKTIVVETEGDTLVVVKRTDLDLDGEGESATRARQMALVDNSSALHGITWDYDVAAQLGAEFDFEVGEWGVTIEEPGGEGYDVPDYSGKNKEIDTDNFEDKMAITLNYTMEEFHQVKAELSKVAHTPEAAVWKLLNLPENE